MAALSTARLWCALAVLLLWPAVAAAATGVVVKAYELPEGGGYPHDVAVSADGTVWYTAQRDGKLGGLDPASGKVELVPLGHGSAPHGVIVGPDAAPWITDSGLNAIVRVDPKTHAVKTWPLPAGRSYANLNTTTFDKRGRLCARRVWSDSKGRIFVSEWKAWKLPGERPQTYAVYVDERDKVWLSDFRANAMVRFDPETEKIDVFPSDRRAANVRQILGRPGEVWAPESGANRLLVFRESAR